MKNIFLALVIFIICSCNNIPTTKYSNEEYFTISDSLNFQNSKELKGLSELLINHTTTAQIRKIHNISQIGVENYLKDEFKPDYSSGFTQLGYGDSIITILEKETKIRQYRLGGFNWSYKIGAIDLEKVYLLCYNDTLVGIYLECIPEVLKEAFKTKYGSGIGYYKDNSIYYKDPKKDKLSVYETRKWENKTVSAEYIFILASRPSLFTEEKLVIKDKAGKCEKYKLLIQNIRDRLEQEKKVHIKKSIEMI